MMRKKMALVLSLGLLIAIGLSILRRDSTSELRQEDAAAKDMRLGKKSRQVITKILKGYDAKEVYPEFSIDYPLDETVFPPEIIAPTFRWSDGESDSDVWLITVACADDKEAVSALVAAMQWRPGRKVWESLKKRSLGKKAWVTVLGLSKPSGYKILSRANVSISTSRDEVGSPIFYRDVPLPFDFAIENMRLIKWRLGDVSSYNPPAVVLENMPVCGNCHSFSANGRALGMDVDYASDKGSYVITPVSEEIVLSKDKVITWSEYKREDGDQTYGLLSQVSPDGRYVISTVKDQSVFVAKPDLVISQLFFPVKGILVFYDRETGLFRSLPGADDPYFVQSNPTWSPDSKHIAFARSKARPINSDRKGVLLLPEQVKEYLEGGATFKYDLYRIPFNKGQGGKAEPIKGASHNGMSNYFPRFSPDGKWIVFTRARNFMLLQPDSNLYIIPASGGKERLMRCNTHRMNSWHSWSPNGRWLVFSSKANTAYTQLFLTHIDKNGEDSPPVLLASFTGKERAANIPEFVNIKPRGIKKIHERFIDEYSYIRSAETSIEYFHDYDRAAEDYRKALAINPKSAEAHVGLGRLWLEKGEQERAQQEFEVALKLDPKNVYAHNEVGIMLACRGKLDEAIVHFRQALKLKPDCLAACKNLGRAMYIQGRFGEAAKYFEQAAKLAPDDAEAEHGNAEEHYNSALALADKGEFDEAIKHYQQAIRLQPHYAKAHNNIGCILANQGKSDEAIEQFRQAVKLQPGFEEAHNNIGTILANQGRFNEAVKSFQQALKIRPDYKDARRNLENTMKELEKKK